MEQISSFSDTLATFNDGVTQASGSGSSTNWWMWIALAELFVLAVMVLGRRWRGLSGKGKTDRFKADALKEDVDFDNVINSSFNARALYDELKVKCHPDRFVGDEAKSMVARELILNISKNRNNAKRLLELKSEAREKLNI